MKLSTIINKNKTLKAKIGKEIVNKQSSSTIDSKTSVSIKSKGSSTIEDDLKTKIAQGLKSTNLLIGSTPEKLKSSNTGNIGSLGIDDVIHQPEVKKRVDDATLIGGYRVVHTIGERNAIDCCYRKLGMIVMVVGDDLSFTEYMLTGELCSNEGWVLFQVDNNDQIVFEDDVILTEDYTILDPTQQIETQKDLNRVLKEILEQLVATPVSGDKNYVHDQYINSSLWTINHPLNKKVSVTITDTAGTVVEGEVTINNGSKVVIKFNSPFKGEAILN